MCEVEIIDVLSPCPSGYVLDIILGKCIREPGSRCYVVETTTSTTEDPLKHSHHTDEEIHSYVFPVLDPCPAQLDPDCKNGVYNKDEGHCYRIEEHMPVISCPPGYNFKARIKSAYAWHSRSYLLCAQQIMRTAAYTCPPGFVTLPTIFEDDVSVRRLREEKETSTQNPQKNKQKPKSQKTKQEKKFKKPSIFENRRLQEVPRAIAAQIIAAHVNATTYNITYGTATYPSEAEIQQANQMAENLILSQIQNIVDPVQYAIENNLISPEESERIQYPAPAIGPYFVTSTTVNDNAMAGGPGEESPRFSSLSKAYKSLYTFLSTAAGAKEATRAEALEELVKPKDTIPSLQTGSILGSGNPILVQYPPKCVMTVSIPLAQCVDGAKCVNKYVLKYLRYLQEQTGLPINWKDYKRNVGVG